MGALTLAGWAVVGVIVASIEKSRRDRRDADSPALTRVCIAGAIVGAAVGQSAGVFVFGQPLGFVCAAVGAELLLHLYRSRGVESRRDDEAARPAQEMETTTARPPVATADPVPTMTSHLSVFATLVEALAWSLLSAVVVAAGGFFGHQTGSRLYPQRYEGIPSDIFFVPLGVVFGVGVAVVAKLVRPAWHAQMLGVIALASVTYGALLYGYAKSHALPSSFHVSFEPDPGVAVRCDAGAACPEANPPLEWSVEGSLSVKVTRGGGVTVDAISLNSYDQSALRSRTFTREQIIEANRFDGPAIKLDGRQLSGRRRIRANEVVSYPVRYYYRTRSGTAERTIVVYIDFADAAGHKGSEETLWRVR